MPVNVACSHFYFNEFVNAKLHPYTLSLTSRSARSMLLCCLFSVDYVYSPALHRYTLDKAHRGQGVVCLKSDDCQIENSKSSELWKLLKIRSWSKIVILIQSLKNEAQPGQHWIKHVQKFRLVGCSVFFQICSEGIFIWKLGRRTDMYGRAGDTWSRFHVVDEK